MSGCIHVEEVLYSVSHRALCKFEFDFKGVVSLLRASFQFFFKLLVYNPLYKANLRHGSD